MAALSKSLDGVVASFGELAGGITGWEAGWAQENKNKKEAIKMMVSSLAVKYLIVFAEMVNVSSLPRL